MPILITGGAGYIGSVTAELLRARGERVVVLDNLSRGHRDAVAAEVPFYEGDIGDRALVMRVVREHDGTSWRTPRKLAQSWAGNHSIRNSRRSSVQHGSGTQSETPLEHS